MAIKTNLVNSGGHELDSIEYFEAIPGVKGSPSVLVVADAASVHGTFKAATRTGEGTTVIASPNANGSLLITDVVISGEKQATSSTIVQFTDGAQTIVLLKPDSSVGPISLSISFRGRVQGWKDARIEMVTAGIADATVLVCYTKVPVGLPFEEWDALR